ncbi:septation protein A [Paracoccus suum]|uniref:Inner membrane-spanning protein YciB n=1 Tax=Paracoccus suum TaxID=2259340 RepID=A0A344PG94_9RHOB|nr:inner membrane-spanning protein YciB [Paracoccus suum]AXC48399.1 septation protein A [Paracoccus suum]
MQPQPRKVSPVLKAALEYGPLILFFVVYSRLKAETVMLGGTGYSGLMVATMIFVPVTVLATLILWRLTGKLSVMQIATVVLLVVFGGLSLWLNDPRFFKMKPTLLYLLFASVLGVSLALRRNWLARLMGEAMPMREEGWRILTGRMALMFAGLAVLNEVVWRTMSEGTWVNFKIFGMTAILFIFFMAQVGLLRRYALHPDSPRDGENPDGQA